MHLRPFRTALLVALFATATSAQTTHIVTTLFGNNFTPKNITITVGDTVRWVELQSNSHNVAQVDYPPTTSSVWNGGFWSGFGGDTDEFEVTFTDVGLIAYVCEPHVGHGMNGTIDVQAALVGEWDDLGGAVAGSNGTPVLAGTGDLVDGTTTSLELTNGLPNGTAWLVLGVSFLGAPFKQGVLVPTPDVLLASLPLDGAGALTLPFTWPAGIPGGASLYWQYWIPDAGAPVGFAASNGVQSTTP